MNTAMLNKDALIGFITRQKNSISEDSLRALSVESLLVLKLLIDSEENEIEEGPEEKWFTVWFGIEESGSN